ncbi:MAG: MOSC domain-containing protein [Gemmatimonadales bacterium]
MRVTSLNLGQPELLPDPFARDGLDRPWRSAIRKRAVVGPVRVTELGLVGDAVADRRDHGGKDQAMLAYAESHYPRWQAELGALDGLGPGGFGENLTVQGTNEAEVRLGDVWAVGECRLEVSLPRIPCENLAKRFAVRDLVKQVTVSGRIGWYLRVLKEGEVAQGDVIRVIERPHPEWTVAQAFRTLVQPKAPVELKRSLARCPALPDKWSARLNALVPEEA